MARKQNLQIDQKISQRLTQAQLRFVKLLELNAPEAEEAVEKELEDNPALELADDSDDLRQHNLTDDGTEFRETAAQMQRADYAGDDEVPWEPAADSDPWAEGYRADTSESLYDYLNSQIDQKKLPPLVAVTAHYIIGNLDTNGYLRRSLPEIVDDMAFGPGIDVDMATAREALDAVRSLYPPGVGASDLRECLMLQLEALPASPVRDDALRVAREGFEEFARKNTHRLVTLLKMPADRVRTAMALLSSLNPKPGASIGRGESEKAPAIIPDFIVDNSGGELSVTLNNRIPELRISRSFDQAVKEMNANADRKRTASDDFVRLNWASARDFIRALRQRQDTLFAVMTAILDIQKEFFLTDDPRQLKPMGLKDVAALTGFDPSVISRATANKYAATSGGIFPLRYFFTDAVASTDSDAKEGDEPTRRQAEEEIQALVEAEDKRHPLSDEEIREALVAKGFDLSRRTVAKYRDRRGIPVARLRKQI